MSTFTRASTATYIDRSGVMKKAEVDEPRFEKEGILIEGRSTNSVNRSSDIIISENENSKYSKESVDVFCIGESVQRVEAKKTKVSVGKSTNFPTVRTGRTSPVTYSYFVKALSGITRVQLSTRRYDSSGESIASDTYYHLSTDKFIYESKYWSVSRTLLANGWVRISQTAKELDGEYNAGGGSVYLQGWLNSVIGEILIGGFQAEDLPFASSYIPTNGTPVTRAADILNLPVSLVPSDAYTFSAYVDILGVHNYQCFYSTGTNNTGLNVGMMTGKDNVLRTFAYGTTKDTGFISSVIDGISLANTIDHTSGDSITYTDGVKRSSSSGIKAAADTSLKLGRGESGFNPLFGHIKNFRIWHQALTPEQIAAL